MCGMCDIEPGTSTSHCWAKIRSSHLKRASKSRQTFKFISRKFKEARSYLLQKQWKSEIAEMDKALKQSREAEAKLMATRERLSYEQAFLTRKMEHLEDTLHGMRLAYFALLEIASGGGFGHQFD